jgi:hypothetical protein
MSCLLWLTNSLGLSSPPASAQIVQRTNSALPAKLFEFHNAFWINLHHVLYVQARARLNTPDSRRRAVAGVSAEFAEESKLVPEERRNWDAALDYYERELAPLDLIFDERLVALTNRIAAQESAPTLQSSGLDSALVRALESAAPAYRSLWWPRHERANRAWVAMINPLLEKYGASLAEQVTKAYQTSWPAKPFRVDVCAYANWAGAYTVDDSARITLSSLDEGNGGTQGLEALFHESLHVLETNVVAELGRQAKAQGKELPRFLSHALIFYMAGEITRRTVAGHKPYAVTHDLWSGEPWSKYWLVLQTYWQPYLDGKTSFAEALRQVVAAS